MSRAQFASAVSSHPVTAHAVGEVVGEVLEGIGTHPDLAVVFVTAGHAGALEDIGAAIRSILSPAVLLGAASAAVIGPGGDVERSPGVALWCGLVGPVVPLLLGTRSAPPFAGSAAILLGDPTSPAPSTWSAALPAMASAGAAQVPAVVGGRTTHPGLLLQDRIHTATAAGALIGPGVRIGTVGSEGGRDIGDPMLVTRAERSMLYELDGRPALQSLTDLVTDRMPADDVRLVNAGLRISVLDGPGETARPGRPALVVRGADRANGALGLDASVETGTLVRFQVRDPHAASDAFVRALSAADPGAAPGALLFRSERRGTAWFDPLPSDAVLVANALPGASLAGCSTSVQLGLRAPDGRPTEEGVALLLLDAVDRAGGPGGGAG